MIPVMEDPRKPKLKYRDRKEMIGHLDANKMEDIERGITMGYKDSLGMDMYVHCPDDNHGFISFEIQ